MLTFRFGPLRAWAHYGAALAVAILFASLSAWVVWQDRSETYDSERRALLNTARLAADDLGATFDQIDALLKSVGRLYADGQESGPEEKARLADYIKKEIADHPIAARLYVADSEGKIVVGGGAFAAAPTAFTVADAAFFKRAAAGDRSLIFEGPHKARFGRGWVIALTRRLDNGKGEFLGAVSASIMVESLTQLFSTLETVDNGAVALWTDTGVLVARFPQLPDAEAQIGADIMPERVKRRLREQSRNQDVYDAVTPFDGVVRLIAYQKVRNSPYVLFWGAPKVALEWSWRRLALGLGLLSATVAAAAFWTARRQLTWAAHLDEDNRLLERRVAERTDELEKKNRALAASERKFSDAMAKAPNPMIMFARDGRMVEVNAAFCSLHGFSRDEALAMNAFKLIPPEDGPSALEDMRRLETGECESYRVERRYLHKDGRLIWMQADVSIVRDASGAGDFFIVQAQDISARLAHEDRMNALNADLAERVEREVRTRQSAQARLAQNEKMAALGQLASGVAHDFNGVLQTVLIGAATIGRRPGDPDLAQTVAATIKRAATRGAALTGRLLAFARRSEPSAEGVDVASVLSGLAAMLKPTLAPGVRIAVAVAPDLPKAAADREQLETALVNLATNAADAIAGDGLVTFAASAYRADDHDGRGLSPGSYVRIDVTDDGAGMDDDTLARAFEPFFTTKAVGKGTGLGLPTARGFAEQSGGALALERRPGGGTTASLWLPLVALDAPDAADPAPATPTVPAALRSLRVLLIDDDDVLRAMLARDLGEHGLVAETAGGGAEALARLAGGGDFDVVVADLAMPGMSGAALIREARRLKPGLPAIILTGDIVAAAAQDLDTLGAPVVRKPVATAALVAAIEAAARAPGERGASRSRDLLGV